MSSFFYTGIALWNNLSNDIKTIVTKSVFKHKLKIHLLSEFVKKGNAVSIYY